MTGKILLSGKVDRYGFTYRKLLPGYPPVVS